MYNFLFKCPRCGKDLTAYDAKNALQLPSITLFFNIFHSFHSILCLAVFRFIALPYSNLWCYRIALQFESCKKIFATFKFKFATFKLFFQSFKLY